MRMDTRMQICLSYFAGLRFCFVTLHKFEHIKLGMKKKQTNFGGIYSSSRKLVEHLILLSKNNFLYHKPRDFLSWKKLILKLVATLCANMGYN